MYFTRTKSGGYIKFAAFSVSHSHSQAFTSLATIFYTKIMDNNYLRATVNDFFKIVDKSLFIVIERFSCKIWKPKGPYFANSWQSKFHSIHFIITNDLSVVCRNKHCSTLEFSF